MNEQGIKALRLVLHCAQSNSQPFITPHDIEYALNELEHEAEEHGKNLAHLDAEYEELRHK